MTGLPVIAVNHGYILRFVEVKYPFEIAIIVDPGTTAASRNPQRKARNDQQHLPDSHAALHYELPISTPVMNTSTPPSPTCSAAVTQGVSM